MRTCLLLFLLSAAIASTAAVAGCDETEPEFRCSTEGVGEPCAAPGETRCLAGCLYSCAMDRDGTLTVAPPKPCPTESCADDFLCEACRGGEVAQDCSAHESSCEAGVLEVCLVDAFGCRRTFDAPCGPALAPPSFALDDGLTVTFVDILRVDADVELNVPEETATVSARVDFEQSDRGYPILALNVPRTQVTALSVDGRTLLPMLFIEVTPPQPTSYDHEEEDVSGPVLNIVSEYLDPGPHTVEIAYALASEKCLSFEDGAVELSTSFSDMGHSDASTVRFSEQLLPSNPEHDAYELVLGLEVIGAQVEQVLFSNAAEVLELASHRWRLTFPEYFATSSPYLHLTNATTFLTETTTYDGVAASIAITVYGRDPKFLRGQVEQILTSLAEFEEAYGPFPHAQLVVGLVMAPFDHPGMEFAGAFHSTDPHTTDHELLHSWFGRGVMPASGNSGWIDEAITTWATAGYEGVDEINPERDWPTLTGVNPYNWETAPGSHYKGMHFIMELDLVLQPFGGVRPLLRQLARAFHHQPINTEMFREFLETSTAMNLEWFFDRIYPDDRTTTPR